MKRKGRKFLFCQEVPGAGELQIHLVLKVPFHFDHNLHFFIDFKRCLEVIAYGDEIEGRITKHLLIRRLV